LLDEHGQEIDSVTVTLDSHQRMHIAHGLFWTNDAGGRPDPFTLITTEDVETGKWRAVREEYQEKALAYVKALDKNGKFKLCIWPEHCIIGSEGHNVTAPINEGLTAWAETRHESVEWVHKGQSIFTEMYSALKAEVEIASDAGTHLNAELIARLATHERMLVCGQAKSHCVNCTVRDLVQHWPKSELHRIWLLSDGMSSVPGFEAAGDQFIDDMREAGLTIVPTARAFDTGVISKPPLQELALSQDQTLLQSETHTQQPSCL
jgi:nicotinamidase/pyrazinamidase